MKNSQRIIGLGLATICTATMLVGCGSKTEYEDTSNIGGVEQEVGDEDAREEVEDELEDVTNSEDGGIEEEVEDALEDETDELDELEVDAEDTSEETEE